MSLRIIETLADASAADTIHAIAEKVEAIDFWAGAVDEKGRRPSRMMVHTARAQAAIDSLQAALGSSEGWRITVSRLETTLPVPDELEGQNTADRSAIREEVYAAVEVGARLDRNYILFVALSTVVAGLGLANDDVAVVIGAMVIAPLLGPNIGFALGAALGDWHLMRRAVTAGLTGIALALAATAVVGALVSLNLDNDQLLARTRVGFDAAVLALASGAAAALSIITRSSSTLVGVMVAAALLPPTCAIGLFMGAGRLDEAIGAATLLAINVAALNLAALAVFLWMGVRPRTWLEQRSARQSRRLALIVWAGLLVGLLIAILLRTDKLPV